MIEVKPLKIKKSNVQELKKRYKWSGSGTKEDPIEISSTEELPGLLYFKTKDLFIRLRSVRHHSIKLKNCRNIEIENSRICNLEMIECWDILVKNNYIGTINLEHCKGNEFEGNKIGGLKAVTEHDPKEKLVFGLVICLAGGTFFWIFTAYWMILITLNISRILRGITPSILIGLIVFIGFFAFMSIILLWASINCIKTIMRLRKLESNEVNDNSVPSIDNFRAELCNYCDFQNFCEENQFLNHLLGAKTGSVPLLSVMRSSTVQSKPFPKEETISIAEQSPKEPMLGRDSYRLRYPKGDFTDLGLIGCVLCLIVPLLILFSVAFYGSELGDLFLGVIIFCLIMYAILVVLAYKKVQVYKKEKRMLEPNQSLKESSTTIETSRCGSCGQSVRHNAKYCQHCGSQLQ